VDFEAVAAAARAMVENTDLALSYTPEQIEALLAFAEEMEERHEKFLKAPKDRTPRAKIIFDYTPYGSRCGWDPSVSDFRDAGWIARELRLNRDEFKRGPFKASAIKEVLGHLEAGDEKANDKQSPATSPNSGDTIPVDQRERVLVWEVIDFINEKRHYLCDSYDGFLEKKDTYPYIDDFGRPIFSDRFPGAMRVPYKTPKEGSERAVGMPWLEIGWPLAVEFIKLRSAAVIAAKKSARLGIVNGLSPESIKELIEGVDGTMVTTDSSYNKTINGECYTEVKFGGMPMDYLTASKVVQADFASIMGLSLASLTSESVADTLGQEQIAMQGSNTTQGDMIRQFEAMFAELALKTLILFRRYASPEECKAWMGEEAHEPRQNPDGSPKESIYDAFMKMDLSGSKLVCRFASGTRADDAVYIKQLQDFIALSNTLRDNTNTPFYDVRPLLERLGKAMDIEGLKPYEPTAAELAAIMGNAMGEAQANAMGQPGQPGQERQAPGGGREDGRRAGGQRGPAPVPGRQGRDRAPATQQNLQGQAQRPRTATS
jgi:hypothetical protein